jgi:hypothetical protein
MAYDLYKSDKVTLLVELGDGIVDNTHASISFIGKNVSNYGTVQNENFLWLLEHFNNNQPPANAMAGQLWFDATANRLRLYDTNSVWNQVPTVIYNSTATNQTNGDFWYDVTNNQLKVRTANGYILIGPNSAATTAQRLAISANINGVPFNGTTDIVVTSTLTNSISTGSYILGDAFNGSKATTWSVDTGAVNTATPYKVVARDSVGDIWYKVGHGQASSTVYADLAEKYLSDQDYPVGTVVSVGGDKEVTQCQIGDRPIGVVSGKPGYMMNSDLVGGTYIALKGRVPVRVQGVLAKGDLLAAGNNGTAQNMWINDGIAFAVALEDSDGSKTVIEAVVL